MMAAVASPKVSRLPTATAPRPSKPAPAARREKAYLNIGELAEHLGVSERTVHTIRQQAWFPKPIALAPRVIRWSVAEVDEAMRKGAPRGAEAEPEALQASREARRVGVVVRNGRIVKEVFA